MIPACNKTAKSPQRLTTSTSGAGHMPLQSLSHGEETAIRRTPTPERSYRTVLNTAEAAPDFLGLQDPQQRRELQPHSTPAPQHNHDDTKTPPKEPGFLTQAPTPALPSSQAMPEHPLPGWMRSPEPCAVPSQLTSEMLLEIQRDIILPATALPP